MADWTRRERTTVHVEYVLPNPTNWAEVGKIYTAINQELGEKAQSDDAVWVVGTDDEIIFRFEKETSRG